MRKVPELAENFIAAIRSLLSEQNHAVLLTGVTLVAEMCAVNHELLQHFRKLVPHLVQTLRSLIMSGFSHEHDVSGITDPFLQIRILQLLRVLGKDDAAASDAMGDMLAQVATNTESSKNVGNAVLYETVRTIVEARSDPGLRVLAVNILGRFLSHTDKNIRYVALSVLRRVVHVDSAAVQRHRAVILDCLKDPDISIRRRALEVAFALINESTIRTIVPELMNFLEASDAEFKMYVATELVLAAEHYATDKRWHADTILQILVKAGAYMRDDLVSDIVQLISQTPELQAYMARRMYAALHDDISQQPLTQVGAWCIGEYGDLLLLADTEPADGEEAATVAPQSEADIVQLLYGILRSPVSSPATCQYAVTALAKISARFPSTASSIKAILQEHETSANVELQQRSVEFSRLFDNATLRQQLLERMPVIEGPAQQEAVVAPAASLEKPHADAAESALPASAKASENLLDLVDDMLGIGGASTPSIGAAAAGDPSPPARAPSAAVTMVAYDRDGLRCVFRLEQEASAEGPMLVVHATSSNARSVALEDFALLAAVPKALKLTMLPPSGTDLPPGGSVQQVMKIANPQQRPVKMRLRLSYRAGGVPAEDTVELGEFPPVV